MFNSLALKIVDLLLLIELFDNSTFCLSQKQQRIAIQLKKSEITSPISPYR